MNSIVSINPFSILIVEVLDHVSMKYFLSFSRRSLCDSFSLLINTLIECAILGNMIFLFVTEDSMSDLDLSSSPCSQDVTLGPKADHKATKGAFASFINLKSSEWLGIK
jgi:hypothetical protein